MRSSLVIIGSGGNASDMLDVVDALREAGRDWEVLGFLDDAREPGSSHLGLPVLGRVDDAARVAARGDAVVFINAVGSDATFRLRPAVVRRTGLPRERFATLAHPAASVSKRARVGGGTCVNYGVSVGGGVTIGDHVYLGVGCVIGHDAVVEDHAVIAPGAVVSGFCRIGENCYVGAGSVIKQKKHVGAGTVVGMGAVVTKDVPAGATWVGVPAAPHEAGGGLTRMASRQLG
jgi:sugar O-acyltransferase (sialic acid O-acetyltransferase NeuD family)